MGIFKIDTFLTNISVYETSIWDNEIHSSVFFYFICKIKINKCNTSNMFVGFNKLINTRWSHRLRIKGLGVINLCKLMLEIL